MSWQPNCAIAQQWAGLCRIAMPVVAVKLRLRGRETSRDLERWSG